jgi:hypothetical protein
LPLDRLRAPATPPVLIQAPSKVHCMPRRRRRRPPIFIDTGSFPFQSAFFTQKEETVKKKIGILVLGAALAFGALGHRAAALAVEQAEREAVLQVRVPVEIQLVVLLEGEVHLMPIAEFKSLQPQHRSSV